LQPTSELVSRPTTTRSDCALREERRSSIRAAWCHDATSLATKPTT
jgi:hypothetical protein